MANRLETTGNQLIKGGCGLMACGCMLPILFGMVVVFLAVLSGGK